MTGITCRGAFFEHRLYFAIHRQSQL
jgi:hypothetical protein